jgi:hypothetical protein
MISSADGRSRFVLIHSSLTLTLQANALNNKNTLLSHLHANLSGFPPSNTLLLLNF